MFGPLDVLGKTINHMRAHGLLFGRARHSAALFSSPYAEGSISALRRCAPHPNIIDLVSSSRRSLLAGILRRTGFEQTASQSMYVEKVIFDLAVAVSVLILRPRHVFSMWGSSKYTFMAARSVGAQRHLNFVNAHPDRHNDTIRASGANPRDPEFVPRWFARRIDEELNAATTVICPSSLVSKDLTARGVAEYKICVSHYGVEVDPSRLEKPHERDRAQNEMINVLYVGQMSRRKGVLALLDSLPGGIRLTAIGPQVSRAVTAAVRLPHQWYPTMTRAELDVQYEECDYFILPSMEDTFGLVVLEAMAHGCVVIVSDACGAADVIRHGENGFIMRSANEVGTLLGAASADPDVQRKLREAAMQTALSCTWEAFSARVFQKINFFESASAHGSEL